MKKITYLFIALLTFSINIFANTTISFFVVNKSKDPLTISNKNWFCLSGSPYPPDQVDQFSTSTTAKLTYSSWDNNCTQNVSHTDNDGNFSFRYNYTSYIWCQIQASAPGPNHDWSTPKLQPSGGSCTLTDFGNGSYEIDIDHPRS